MKISISLRFIQTTVLITRLALRNQFSTCQAWSPTQSFSDGSRTKLFMSSSSSKKTEFEMPQHVVIVGAGIIGTSTAYYLAKEFNIASTLVDASGIIAPAASSKAGGFLALDWNDYGPVGRLARRSFDLHQDIANDLGSEKIQYRRLTCASIRVDPNAAAKPGGKKLEYVEWAQTEEEPAAILQTKPLGDERTIAQVHPKLLCNTLWEFSSKPVSEGGVGSTLIQGKVISPVHEDGKLLGVKLEDGTLVKGDAVLFSCGPWTANIMTGVKYHSVVIPTDRTLSQCVFFSGCGDPEVYVRPDNTAYCCGFPDPAVKVTELPGGEEVRPEAVQRIVDAVKTASGETGGALTAEPTLTSSCYLPTTPDNLPIMGVLPEECGGGAGCFIATGHGCWGILMGPGSGESMATLMATGESRYIDLKLYNPSRFKEMLILQ